RTKVQFFRFIGGYLTGRRTARLLASPHLPKVVGYDSRSVGGNRLNALLNGICVHALACGQIDNVD
ncbi:MAG: hypothetical protein ACI87A_002921, partial [Planctomycetota bacterium]